MGIIPQYSRIAHHTLYGSTGLTFTIPPTEDFTDGSWNVNGTELFLSEIGVSEDDNKAYIRIGNNINEFNFGSPVSLIIDITYADLVTALGASTLEKGTVYFISDRNIWIQALDINTLSPSAYRLMQVIDTTAYVGTGVYKGVWHSTLSVSINDKVIWGGKLWINTTGSVGSATNDSTLNGTNWTLLTTDAKYFNKLFNIKYDYINDIITEQSDDRGNVVNYDGVTSYIDITDWGNTYIYNNNTFGIYNNRLSALYLNDNICGGRIYNNLNSTSDKPGPYGKITYNKTTGSIYNNGLKVGAISNNVIMGSIYSNEGSYPDMDNSISFNVSFDIYSNAQFTGIDYNSIPGAIYSNIITDETIRNNTNLGDIRNNTSMNIYQNSNNGAIYSNNINGNIMYNLNGSVIYNNTNNGNITNNSNTGPIYNNSNNGSIMFNANIFDIYNNNSNVGEISYNTNGGYIRTNSNPGDIQHNTNTGNINNNSIVGYISYNKNNGNINTNTQSSGTCNIGYNTNNGNISGARTADILGTIVNI